MPGRRHPKLNRLLSKLHPASYDMLLPHFELIALPRDCDIYQHSTKIDFIYFPISSIVAVVNVLKDGATPEVATIGNDGLVGINLFMGAHSITSKTIVQSTGFAYRIKATIIKKQFDADIEFRNLMLRYLHVLLTQAAQIAACNRYHTIEQQLCRFLLTSLDRWNTNRISLTHQRVADLLGVRRASISEVSAGLAKAGHIKYHRGCVTLLNHAGLEERVCECYAVVKHAVDSLLK